MRRGCPEISPMRKRDSIERSRPLTFNAENEAAVRSAADRWSWLAAPLSARQGKSYEAAREARRQRGHSNGLDLIWVMEIWPDIKARGVVTRQETLVP